MLHNFLRWLLIASIRSTINDNEYNVLIRLNKQKTASVELNSLCVCYDPVTRYVNDLEYNFLGLR